MSNVERIGEMKINMDTITDAELLALIDHQTARVVMAQQALNIILGQATFRQLICPEMREQLVEEIT